MEEWQRQVAEPVIGLECGERTLPVSSALGLDACEMFAADVGELEHEGVSTDFFVIDVLGRVTHRELASHGSRLISFKVDVSICDALWILVSTGRKNGWMEGRADF